MYQECVYLGMKALEASLVLPIVIFSSGPLRPLSTSLKYLSTVKVTTTNTCLSGLEYSIPHSAHTTVGDEINYSKIPLKICSKTSCRRKSHAEHPECNIYIYVSITVDNVSHRD